ncbi:MAG: LptF/LptG family permease [Bacteroidales bacterium]
MKRIDWYIIKKFLSTFFLAIALILLIVIVFDVSEKIDDFIQEKAPLDEILFDYYLNFIPFFVNMFSPLFTFIAVVFFTGKMAFNSEIIAILSSGISFRRMLFPFLLSAFFLSLMTFYLANFVIPVANENRLAFEMKYIYGSGEKKERNIHLQTSENDYVYVQRFNQKDNTGFRFTHEQFDDQGLVYKLTSEYIRWDSLENNWILENYTKRYMDGNTERLIHGQHTDTTMILVPEDFTHQVKRVEVLNYFELREFIKEEEQKGSGNISVYKVEKHQRNAFPFATVVFTIIGVSLSSRKVRGGIGLHLAAGITISFAFILFMQISTTFAIKSDLQPWLAVWLPNFAFTVVGLLLIRLAPK